MGLNVTLVVCKKKEKKKAFQRIDNYPYQNMKRD